jgi:hypothetical protein
MGRGGLRMISTIVCLVESTAAMHLYEIEVEAVSVP